MPEVTCRGFLGEAAGLSGHRLVAAGQQAAPRCSVWLLCFSIDAEREGMGVTALGGRYSLIHSLLITLRRSFTCLGQQICTEDCCRGYYATVCYFNEVLSKIVSTSGNREMTCHKALVKLSNMPEPTDLQDTVQG